MAQILLWAPAANVFAVVVFVVLLVRNTQPLRTLIALIAVFSKDDQRTRRAMKILGILWGRNADDQDSASEADE